MMQQLCNIDDIENFGSRGFDVDGVSIFVVRKNRRLFAYVNRCPHLGIPLEWFPDRFLDIDAELIQCSTHGALFTIDKGRCIYGPCSGSSLTPVDIELQGEQIWISNTENQTVN